MKSFLNISALQQVCRPGAGKHTSKFRILSSKQTIDQSTLLHQMVHPMYAQFSVSRDRRTELQVPKRGGG